MNHFTLHFVIGVAVMQSAAACGASFDGFTEPFRKIDVAASETGTVAQLLVHEGDRVAKGQALATLDNDVLEVSREIATANVRAKGKLDSAIAERDLRKTRLERLEPLRTEGHASQEEVDRARSELEVAEANLQVVREQRQLDELERKKVEAMIERRTLRSPIDGYVLKIQKDEREFVSANSASVAIVVQLDPLRVVFSLPTAYAAKLSVGSAADLELPESGAKVRGKVEFVAPVTEAESGTVRVKVLIDNAGGAYRCGIRCLLNAEQAKEVPADKTFSAGSIQK
ncbi:MAG: efflux RND transporter periplasmic adaptor subunit [Thermoguttaceae bacterium]